MALLATIDPGALGLEVILHLFVKTTLLLGAVMPAIEWDLASWLPAGIATGSRRRERAALTPRSP